MESTIRCASRSCEGPQASAHDPTTHGQNMCVSLKKVNEKAQTIEDGSEENSKKSHKAIRSDQGCIQNQMSPGCEGISARFPENTLRQEKAGLPSSPGLCLFETATRGDDLCRDVRRSSSWRWRNGPGCPLQRRSERCFGLARMLLCGEAYESEPLRGGRPGGRIA